MIPKNEMEIWIFKNDVVIIRRLFEILNDEMIGLNDFYFFISFFYLITIFRNIFFLFPLPVFLLCLFFYFEHFLLIKTKKPSNFNFISLSLFQYNHPFHFLILSWN